MAKLYFYYSAMNAGKSTTLLQSSHNYRERGMDTLLFTPAIDNRFASGKIHSRIGLEQDAIIFDRQFDLYQYVFEANARNEKLRCILIDEAQFLTKEQVGQLVEITHHCKLPVLAYGLRTDFLAEPFEGSQYLLAWAEELIEIKTICQCSKKATMNVRLDKHGNVCKQGEQIQIGGNESYVATCRRCFNQMMRGEKKFSFTNDHTKKQPIKELE